MSQIHNFEHSVYAICLLHARIAGIDRATHGSYTVRTPSLIMEVATDHLD